MKLKRLPDDFQVEELTDFRPNGGQFALYRLRKRSLGTPEAVEAVLRRWKLPRHAVSYGGLKDRHAVTLQYLTIRKGPHRDLREASFELAYQGQADREFGPSDIVGNRFQLVLRDLSEADAKKLSHAFDAAIRDGLPNYFDDQRFGSLGYSGEFIAPAWCKGDYERALWLAIADSNPHDRPDEKKEKQLLRDNWGDWIKLKAALQRSHRRSIITYLADKPGDFRGAIARVRVDLRSLYLAAFQSAVWNQMLANWLRRYCPAETLRDVDLRLGPVPFFGKLGPDLRKELAEMSLPLPSARGDLEPGPIEQLTEETLAAFGLTRREVRVKYPRDSFFSKGDRPVMSQLRKASQASDADDLHPGKRKLRLSFELQRGAYATILVKRMTECP